MFDDQGAWDGHKKRPDDIIPAPARGCPSRSGNGGGTNGNGTGGNGNNGSSGFQPVTLCHATGSATNPYVVITVDNQGALNGHLNHPGDIIPAPGGLCPSGSTSGGGNTNGGNGGFQPGTRFYATRNAAEPQLGITIDHP